MTDKEWENLREKIADVGTFDWHSVGYSASEEIIAIIKPIILKLEAENEIWATIGFGDDE